MRINYSYVETYNSTIENNFLDVLSIYGNKMIFLIGEGKIIKLFREYMQDHGYEAIVRRAVSKELSTICLTPSNITLLLAFIASLVFAYIFLLSLKKKDKSRTIFIILSASIALLCIILSVYSSKQPIGSNCESTETAQRATFSFS